MVGMRRSDVFVLSRAMHLAIRTARGSIRAAPSNSRSLIASMMSSATGDESGAWPWRSVLARGGMTTDDHQAQCRCGRATSGCGGAARGWNERLTERVQHAAKAPVLTHLARRQSGVALEHVPQRRRRREVEQQRDLLHGSRG